jgi:carbamoyl-phosphate synthase small subunit
MILFEDLVAFNPDGYFLSNGPGDLSRFCRCNSSCKEILLTISHYLESWSSSNGLANGISTYKMFNGHRGLIIL